MSENNVPAVPAQIVDVAVNLDKDDVAAILMSRAEDHLKHSIKACQQQEKALKKEQETLDKTLERQLKQVADDFFSAASGTLRAAASELKAKSVEVSIGTDGYNEKSGRGRGGTVRCYMTVTGEKPRINWKVNQDAPMTQEVRDTLTALKAKAKEISQNNKEWMQLRKKLADLPTLERRAKAAVAEQRLKSTDEGSALVDMLDGQLEDSIKLLGVS